MESLQKSNWNTSNKHTIKREFHPAPGMFSALVSWTNEVYSNQCTDSSRGSSRPYSSSRLGYSLGSYGVGITFGTPSGTPVPTGFIQLPKIPTRDYFKPLFILILFSKEICEFHSNFRSLWLRALSLNLLKLANELCFIICDLFITCWALAPQWVLQLASGFILKVENPVKPSDLVVLTETLTLVAGYLEAKSQNICIVLEAEMLMEGKAVKQYSTSGLRSPFLRTELDLRNESILCIGKGLPCHTRASGVTSKRWPVDRGL